MSYTDVKDAPPARGVPPRVVCPEPLRTELVTALNAEQSVFRVWCSDGGHVWATRVTSGRGPVRGKPGLFTGCGQTLDAGNPAAMRNQLVALGVLKPGPEWLTTAEVAELFGASVSSVTGWARCGRMAGVEMTRGPRGARKFRAAHVHALRERQMAPAA